MRFAAARARAAFDLAIVSVLLDAGAGPDWRYEEGRTGETFARSEGLAVASFDLFIGGWMWQNSQGRHVPHYLLIPAYLLTFMLGPLGLLYYVIVRAFYPPQIQAVL